MCPLIAIFSAWAPLREHGKWNTPFSLPSALLVLATMWRRAPRVSPPWSVRGTWVIVHLSIALGAGGRGGVRGSQVFRCEFERRLVRDTPRDAIVAGRVEDSSLLICLFNELVEATDALATPSLLVALFCL